MKILLFLFFFGSVSHAGEGLFNRAYTVETVPGQHYELEQTIRNRTQRSFGEYSAYDLKSEFEYGITDNLQMAFYVNTEYLHAKNAPDDNDPNGETGFNHDGFSLQSLSLEFLYRVWNPVTDPIGLAFSFEPEWDFYDMHNGDKEYDSGSNEYRIILQKNFLEDQLILVYNIVIETEYFRYANRETQWMGELDWNNEVGATYRFAANWYGGFEARNHNEAGNFYSHDHSVYWAGPSIHYANQKLWATFGIMKQIYGLPSGPDESGSDQGTKGYFLHSHEMWETTLKVGLAF